MKKLFPLLLLTTGLLAGTQPGHAQAPAWQTALAATGTSSSGASGSNVTAMTTDASGNVYVAGSFVGTLTLGNVSLTSSSTGYPTDAYVAKWVPASNSFAWVARIASTPRAVPAGTFSFNNRVNSLAVSGSNVYVGGSFSEPTATFGSTVLTNASSTGTRDAFVARLTDAGSSASWAWAQRLGGTGEDNLYSVAAGGTSVYAAGIFSGTASGFGSSSLTSAGGLDAFVTKLTDAGTAATTTWTQRLGGTGDEYADKVALAGSTLYVSGAFSNTVSFGSTALTSAGSYDGYVTKLTDAGTTVDVGWTQTVSSTGADEVKDLVVAGNLVYLIGVFSAATTLGSTALFWAGGIDGLVAKLTDAGSTSTYTWAKSMGGPRDEFPNCLVVNSGGKLYVGGEFGYNGNSTTSASATFGATTLQSAGGSDAFVTKLIDTGGNASFAWTQQAGSTYGDTALGIALSGTRVYVGGLFVGPSVVFGSQILTNPITNGTASAGFFASLTDATLPVRAASLPGGLRLYPNPASTRVTVPVPDAPGQPTAALTLLDALGRTVRTAQPTPGQDYALDLSGLAPGLYVVQVQAGETLATQPLRVQ